MTVLFSIVTPCYNGRAFLDRALSSLAQQRGNFNLEWVIVDDCSSDNGLTKNKILEIQKRAPFPVKTVFLESNHHGSMSAYAGALHSAGDYIIILDQDDMLTHDALSVFNDGISRYKGIDTFAGLCGRCVKLDGSLVGTPFPWEEKLSNELEIRHVDKIRGELFQCTRKDLILDYFKGMKPGYTNGWAWSRIARHYSYLYTSQAVRVYDTTNPNSTSNLKRMVYLDGQFETLLEYLRLNTDYLKQDPIFTSRLLLQIARIGLHMEKSVSKLSVAVGEVFRIRFFSLVPVAYVRVLWDRFIGRARK